MPPCKLNSLCAITTAESMVKIEKYQNCNLISKTVILTSMSVIKVIMSQHKASDILYQVIKSSINLFDPEVQEIFFKTKILAWEFVTRSCLKPQNPCSNHEIHVLFEHGFYLKKPKLGPDLHARRYTGMRCGHD